MCLLILAHQVAPTTPLVVTANRDEFHARPTAVSDFWEEQPDLLAGRDLEQGGTWMGITRNGRFAAITNYRDPARTAPSPRSRGELPLNYLAGAEGPETYLGRVAEQGQHYAGFNLLLGDSDSLWYFSNSLPVAQRSPTCLQPGIYGLSNALLDTPWPKVGLGKAKLQQVLDSGALSHDQLSAVINDRQLADPGALRLHGMSSDMDQLLSAQFIVTSQYGTRSNTTLWTQRDGLVSWRELSFNASGARHAVRELEFQLT